MPTSPCLAIVKNAVSTLVEFLALVSRREIPLASANALASSSVTAFCAVRSALLPMRSLIVDALACRFTSSIHSSTCSNDVALVTS